MVANVKSTSKHIVLASQLAAILTIFFGVLVFIGWTFNISILKHVYHEWIAMAPNTAVCFILLGAGLLLSHQEKKIYHYAAVVCTAIVLVAAILVFFGYILHI